MIAPAPPELVHLKRQELYPHSDPGILAPYGHQHTAVWRVEAREGAERFSVFYAAGGVPNPDVVVGPTSLSKGILYRKREATWVGGYEGLVDVFSDQSESSVKTLDPEELLIFSAIMRVDPKRAHYPSFIKGAQYLALSQGGGSKTRKLADKLGIPFSNLQGNYKGFSLPK